MRLHLRAERGRGFTLVELLVVIAIITILIAILLPAITKIRRRAIVLAAPIAYVGVDQMLHVTTVGGADVVLCGPVAGSEPWGARLDWSPSGTNIACPFNYPPPKLGAYIAMVEPASGQVRRLPNSVNANLFGGVSFLGWYDSDTFLDWDWGWTYRLRETQSGAVCSQLGMTPGDLGIPRQIQRLPSKYGGSEYVADVSGRIYLCRRDLSQSKLIWRTPDGDDRNLAPRVDPLGEWVAWTYFLGAQARVAVKSLKDPAATPPTILSYNGDAVFCDWTESGDVLVNVRRAGTTWSLEMWDKNGHLVRSIPTDVPPAPHSVASWRKYQHR